MPNHSSDQHEWFQRALREGPGSPLRERYHFRPGKGMNGDEPPNDWESIFGGPAWTRTKNPDGTPGDWYLHLFAPQQPDFDWDNAAVRDEFRSVLRFWLDMGIDGFRIDVAHGLVKADGLPDAGAGQLRLLGGEPLPFFDQDGVHEIYRSWRRILAEYGEERIGVAEAWTPSRDRTALYLRPDELHQAFNFPYLKTGWDAAELREVIEESLDSLRPVGAARHLGALQPRRRPPPDAVRRQRAASPRRDAADAGAARLRLRLPGRGTRPARRCSTCPTRPARTRRSSRTTGRRACATAAACRCRGPPTARPSASVTAAAGCRSRRAGGGSASQAQTGDPASTLELYRRALHLRRDHPDLGAGDAVEWLPAPEGVLAFRRGDFVCTANTTPVAVELPALPGRVLLAGGPHDGGAVLPGDTTVWWSVA